MAYFMLGGEFMPIESKATILNINQSMSPSSDNAIGFCKPMFEDIFLFSCELAASMDRPPYYGDEIDLGFWEKLNMEFGEPDGTLKIVCIGNSLTEGYGGGGTNWPDVWKDLSGHDIINKGISGETSGQMLARFNADVVSQSPNYCIIECGTNDCHLGVPLATCKSNIQAMVSACLANNIRPRFVHYIQRKNQMQLAIDAGKYSFDPDYMAQYLEDVWEFEQSLGYPCLLLNDSTDVDEDNANMSYFYNTENDFIHPNALGYEQWASQISLGFVDMSSSMPKENLPLVAVIGSSLCSGAPYTMDKPDVDDDIYSWTHTFRDITNYDVRNKGIAGDTSDNMYARFNTDVTSLSPDYCIMEVCVNDYPAFGISHLQTSKDNTLAMLNICIANNIKPIFIVAIPRLNQQPSVPLTVTQFQEWINYQKEIKSYIESLGYTVYPYYDAIDSSVGVVDLSLTSDGLHPNVDGYIKVGEMLSNYLNDLSKNIIDNHIYSLHEGWKYKYYYNQKKFTVLDENSSIVYEKNDVVAINQFPIDFSVHKSHQFEIIINDASSFSTFYIPTGLVKKIYGDSPTVNNGYIPVINNCYLPNYFMSERDEELIINPPLVVIIGDSITAGYPYTDNKPGEMPNDWASWTATFRELSGYRVINQAIGGTKSGDTWARFSADVLSLNPDYCIVEHGNDCFYGLDNFNTTTAVYYKNIADACEENNIKLIFVQPIARVNMIDYDTVENLYKHKEYMFKMHEYEKSLGCPSFIEYYDQLDEREGFVNQSLLADGVHPTLEGYKIVGKRLTPQIMAYIEGENKSNIYKARYVNRLAISSDSYMKYTINPQYDLVKYPSTIGGTQGCVGVNFANKAIPTSQVYEDNFIPSHVIKTPVTFKAQMLQCRWILAIMGLTMFPMLEPILRPDEEQNNRPVYEPWLIWGVMKFLGNHEFGGPYYPWDDEDAPNIDVMNGISPNWSY